MRPTNVTEEALKQLVRLRGISRRSSAYTGTSNGRKLWRVYPMGRVRVCGDIESNCPSDVDDKLEANVSAYLSVITSKAPWMLGRIIDRLHGQSGMWQSAESMITYKAFSFLASDA